MCGIFGWTLRESAQKVAGLETALAIIAYEQIERGTHGWGYFGWGIEGANADEIQYKKGEGPLDEGCVIVALARNQNLAGHTRYATLGEHTARNAHPFMVWRDDGYIVGAHNGAVRNYDKLNRQYGRDAQVDSEHLFHHIAERKAMNEIVGYGAVEWVDTRLCMSGEFLLWRFNHTDLHVAEMYNGETPIGMVWCSTDYAIDKAAAITGLSAVYYETVEGQVYLVKADELVETAHKWDCAAFERIIPTGPVGISPSYLPPAYRSVYDTPPTDSRVQSATSLHSEVIVQCHTCQMYWRDYGPEDSVFWCETCTEPCHSTHIRNVPTGYVYVLNYGEGLSKRQRRKLKRRKRKQQEVSDEALVYVDGVPMSLADWRRMSS